MKNTIPPPAIPHWGNKTHLTQTAFELLLNALQKNRHLVKFRQREVTLLLDVVPQTLSQSQPITESHMGFSPNHVDRLIRALAAMNIWLKVWVLQSGKALAHFPSQAYRRVGCLAVSHQQLAALPNPPDVVYAPHALAHYESTIPGPFIRLGPLSLTALGEELHGRAFLQAQQFAALIDSAMVGYCAHWVSETEPTPLWPQTAVLNCQIAIEKVNLAYTGNIPPHLRQIIIVGQGQSEWGAITALQERCGKLIFLVTEPDQLLALRQQATHVRFVGSHPLELHLEPYTPATLQQWLGGTTTGLILAHKPTLAPVVSLAQIALMARNGVVVDMTLAQGGSVAYLDNQEATPLPRRVLKNQQLIQALERVYFAGQNLADSFSLNSSMAQSTAVLPYLAALLVNIAIHGSPHAATEALLALSVTHFESLEALSVEQQNDFYHLLKQDLRNGLSVVRHHKTLKICQPTIPKPTATKLKKIMKGV